MKFVACCAAAVSCLVCSTAAAQDSRIDFSVGLSREAGRGAVSLVTRAAPGARIRLGSGIRLSHYAGAPASFTNRGTAGSTPSTLSIDPSVTGIDLMVVGEVDLTPRFGFGANIDVVGLAFGGGRTTGGVEVKPARLSLLLYGNRDRGSLNSELYLGFRANRRLGFRAGVSHYVVGYQAPQTKGSRYLRFDTVPFVAMSLPMRDVGRRRTR